MKIAVNTRLLLSDKLEGIGWFSYETLKRITQKHTEHEFFFIFDRAFSAEFIFSKNITPVVVPPQARHPFLYYLWFEWSIPYILRKTNADLFLSPDGYISLKTNIPTTAVIHDINFAHRPKDLPFWHRKFYNHYFPQYAQYADRIVTVSEYSKNDICETYSIDNKKIDVVYNGANKLYKPLSPKEIDLIRHEISNNRPYFIFVGSLHPRKNIIGMLKAYEQFRSTSDFQVNLVIVGDAMFNASEIEKTYSAMRFADDVLFTGRLAPEKLSDVMGAALALVFVPFFEGFGIPVLEAMYCDVPVVASNTTSIPEVGGEAVLYTNPYSINSIASAMKQIASDHNLRFLLVENSRKQREKFSWDITAEKLWESMMKTME